MGSILPELYMAVEQKFGRDLYQNYMRELLSIRQTSDVMEYATRFDNAKHKVLMHNRELDDMFFVQKFIDGLKYSISSAIVLHKPRMVDAALSLDNKEELENETNRTVKLNCCLSLSLSQCDAAGIQGKNTIKLQGNILNQELLILVD